MPSEGGTGPVLNPTSVQPTAVPDSAPAAPVDGDGGRSADGVILTIFTLAVLALAALMFVKLERDALNDPVGRAARGELTATSPDSLVRAENLSRALQEIDDLVPDQGGIATLRVAPDRIDATAIYPDGALRLHSVDGNLHVESTDAGTGGGQALVIGKIDPAAPERILAAAERRYDLEREQLNYFVLTPTLPDAPEWTAFFRSRGQNALSAAADGSDVRPLGTPPGGTRRAQEQAQRDADQRIEQVKREAEQRRRCLAGAQSASEAARCLR